MIDVSNNEILEKYKLLFDNAADLIAVVDATGVFLDLNKKFEEESGYKKNEMIGKNIFECGIVTESSAETIAYQLGEMLANVNAWDSSSPRPIRPTHLGGSIGLEIKHVEVAWTPIEPKEYAIGQSALLILPRSPKPKCIGQSETQGRQGTHTQKFSTFDPIATRHGISPE